jgi:hypothetical protein
MVALPFTSLCADVLCTPVPQPWLPASVSFNRKGSERCTELVHSGPLESMIEVAVPGSVERALAECSQQGLAVRSERELGGRPGSHHYHLAFPGKPGTLELNEWQGSVWFSVNERRDCGWASELAHEIAATMAQAQLQEPP